MLNDKKGVKLNGYKSVDTHKVEKKIDGQLYGKMKAMAAKEKVTVNSLLQFTLHKILSNIGNTTQTVIGTAVSDTNLPSHCVDIPLELFLNILPFIVNHKHTDDMATIDMIRNIHGNLNEANSRSKEISLPELQKDGEELFDVLFVCDNFVGMSNYYNYPLCFSAYEENDLMKIQLFYASELFGEDSMNHLLDSIQFLIEQILSNTNQKVKELKHAAK